MSDTSERNWILWIGIALALFGGGAIVIQGTRGLRNNNPLNIELTSPPTAWQGAVTPNTDGTFVQFSSMPYGVRAAYKIFSNYYAQGYQTITALISELEGNDPSNPIQNYITSVANSMGIDPNATVDLTTQMPTLLTAAFTFESGFNPVSDADLQSGIALAQSS